MKIQSVGRILVVTLVIVNLVIVAIGYSWMKGFDKLEKDWQSYSQDVERKSTLITLMQQALGYGGMIHSLNNYLLRVDKKYLFETHLSLQQLNIALVAYSQMSLSEQEKSSLLVLEELYLHYLKAASEAELLNMRGMNASLIDLRIKVDDFEAIEAMDTLFNYVTKNRFDRIHAIAERVELVDQRSVVYATVISILLFGMAAYFIWFLRRQLMQPIETLLRAFDDIDPVKNVSQRLPVSKNRESTELDELAKSGNRFLDEVEYQLQSQKQAEQKATESQQRIATILNNTAEGIITIDAKGFIQTYNPKIEELFGYDCDELEGKTVNCLMAPDERIQHQSYLDNASVIERKIINTNRELWGLRKNGESFPIELTVSSTEIIGQKCYIGIIHDISVRKANEETLLAAKTEAESANEAKSQFLSAMSHELRTPLNAILGFSQLMVFNTADPLSSNNTANVKQILQAGEHLLTLINEILDLTKIEAGNFEVEFSCVSLVKVIDECVDLVNHQADKAGIVITVDQSIIKAPPLHSIFTRLKQIIVNFLTNAIKYNNTGGYAKISCKLTDNKMLQIEVTDNGAGISEENYQHVFEPFRRFDKKAIEIEGTGIGLSVCMSLVEALKGEIGFYSKENSGSTFYVRIPVYLDLAQKPQ